MNEALGLIAKLLTMSKLELEVARDSTDNPKFKEIIQSVIVARFPLPPVEIHTTNRSLKDCGCPRGHACDECMHEAFIT